MCPACTSGPSSSRSADLTGRRVHRDYDRLASLYDRLWARYVGVSVGRTLRGLELPDGARVLDVGCGTGVLLSALARRRPGLELTGLDASPGMLRRARSRLGTAAALDLGDASALPYPDGSFDAVVSTSVLHSVPGPLEPVLSEWARVLAPGGQMSVTDWRADHVGTRAYNALLGVIGRRERPLEAATLSGAMTASGLEVTALERFQVDGWGLLTARGRSGGTVRDPSPQ